jgi:hypothetical protein
MNINTSTPFCFSGRRFLFGNTEGAAYFWKNILNAHETNKIALYPIYYPPTQPNKLQQHLHEGRCGQHTHQLLQSDVAKY